MEVKDLSTTLDEIKNRFSSRFITYFIIYWMIFHWQITVGLLWYDKTQIQAEGCKSIFEFITDQLSKDDSWFKIYEIEFKTSNKPLVFALFSTILFPIIKTIILALDAFIIVWRKNWISRINKDELVNRNIELEKKLTSISDVDFLNGKWYYQISGNNRKKISISNGKWYEEDENSKKDKDEIILNFYFNQHNNTLLFILNSLERNVIKERLIHNFTNIMSPNYLSGNIDFDKTVTMQRIQTFELSQVNNQSDLKKKLNKFKGAKIIDEQNKTP